MKVDYISPSLSCCCVPQKRHCFRHVSTTIMSWGVLIPLYSFVMAKCSILLYLESIGTLRNCWTSLLTVRWSLGLQNFWFNQRTVSTAIMSHKCTTVDETVSLELPPNTFSITFVSEGYTIAFLFYYLCIFSTTALSITNCKSHLVSRSHKNIPQRQRGTDSADCPKSSCWTFA